MTANLVMTALLNDDHLLRPMTPAVVMTAIVVAFLDDDGFRLSSVDCGRSGSQSNDAHGGKCENQLTHFDSSEVKAKERTRSNI